MDVAENKKEEMQKILRDKTGIKGELIIMLAMSMCLPGLGAKFGISLYHTIIAIAALILLFVSAVLAHKKYKKVRNLLAKLSES